MNHWGKYLQDSKFGARNVNDVDGNLQNRLGSGFPVDFRRAIVKMIR